jgi:hypothetical protein
MQKVIARLATGHVPPRWLKAINMAPWREVGVGAWTQRLNQVADLFTSYVTHANRNAFNASAFSKPKGGYWDQAETYGMGFSRG